MIENEDVVKQLLKDANFDTFDGEMEKDEFIHSILYRWLASIYYNQNKY